MPPGYGHIDRFDEGQCPTKTSNEAEGLSDTLLKKVVKLYQCMDEDLNGAITRTEARKHFKRFGEVSANAMFHEVDEDGNNEITLEEFVDFWQQVKRSGYKERS